MNGIEGINFFLKKHILVLTIVIFCIPLSQAFALTISGSVLSLDGTGIQNAEVRLSGSSTVLLVTDNTGAYSFSGLISGGTYTVATTQSGTLFTPASRTYSNLTVDQLNQNFTNGKLWSGAGTDRLASNPNNWADGEIPLSNDIVRFNNTKGCLWDLNITLDRLELGIGFSSSVTAGIDMGVSSIIIQDGEANFNSHEIQISKNFTHTGGTFTWTFGGSAFWHGTAVQTVSMVKNNLGGNRYGSYFENFRVASSSTIQTMNNIIIDGTFNISQGRFEAGSSTLTLTGGSQIGAGPSTVFQWDDSSGFFFPGTGSLTFNTSAGKILINQGGNNEFFNVSVLGSGVTLANSNLVIKGALHVGDSATMTQFDLGNNFTDTIYGPVTVGPNLLTGASTLTIGKNTVNFKNTVTISTGTMKMVNTTAVIQGSLWEVGAQGTLSIEPTGTSTLQFFQGSRFYLNRGTLLIEEPCLFTSTAAGTTRYTLDIDGIVNIQSSSIFESIDINGFHLGAHAQPLSLKSMDFRQGLAGGAALNFDPISVSSVEVSAPQFDSSISTNVRALFDSNITPTAQIDVTAPGGAHSDVSYKYDPASIVHWGILGTPTQVTGIATGPTEINWNWTPVNKPLGYIVTATTGGPVSPPLTFGTTFWIETQLSTNTAYSRLIKAYTDTATADSSAVSLYSLAAPPGNVLVYDMGFSSMAITWERNGNPSDTIYSVEKSTTGLSFVLKTSGTWDQIVPFHDLNLKSRTTYYFRIEAFNHDQVSSTIVAFTTTTLPVPPPLISSITPSSVGNLGTQTLTLSGLYFQTGATVILQKGSLRVPAKTTHVNSPQSVTASFNFTGIVAGDWDLTPENPDGGISSASSLLTVTDATSTAFVTIQSFDSHTALTLTSQEGQTILTLSADSLSDSRIYLSNDPETVPLSVDPADIATANTNLQGLTLVPGSLREIKAYSPSGVLSGGFNSSVTLQIGFTDADDSGILDNVNLRAATLRMMTLDENNHTWTLLSGGSVDQQRKRVLASLQHFSVYGLFGSDTPPNLDGVHIFPNPWKPGSGGKFDAAVLTINQLTEMGTVHIYTLDGHRVRDLTYQTSDGGIISWDGRNDQGDFVVSGVYLIDIKPASSAHRTFKLGIER